MGKKTKKGEETGFMRGIQKTIHAIEACMNSGLGGVITLKVLEEDLSKRQTLSTDDFDKAIDQHFINSHQGLLNGAFEMEDYDPARQTRKVFVKARGNQLKVLHESLTYTKASASIAQHKTTKEHIEIFARDRVHGQLPKLPTPEECIFKKRLEFSKRESKLVEFKNCAIKTIDKRFEEKCGRYICGFANTLGGHLIFGVDDNGIIDRTIPMDEKESFRRALNKRLQDMAWLHLQNGHIEPKEGEHFHWQFMPISGIPDGQRRYMIVILTIQQFSGIVYYKEPSCPIIDPENESGYRMMICQEWYKYLVTQTDPSKQEQQPGKYYLCHKL